MTSNPDSEWQDASSSTLDTSNPTIKSTRFSTTKEIRRQEMQDNCVLRGVSFGIFGGVLGLALGLLTGGSEVPAMQDKMTGRQQLMHRAKQIGRTSWPPCKSFILLGFMYSATECTMEKARGKHDIATAAVAGCVAGSVAFATGGPKAACSGCAGCAALAAIIEKCVGKKT